MFKIIRKVFNVLLNYVSYMILGLFGLGIFNVLYLAWFTEAGRSGLIVVGTFSAVFWAFCRAFR